MREEIVVLLAAVFMSFFVQLSLEVTAVFSAAFVFLVKRLRVVHTGVPVSDVVDTSRQLALGLE